MKCNIELCNQKCSNCKCINRISPTELSEYIHKYFQNLNTIISIHNKLKSDLQNIDNKNPNLYYKGEKIDTEMATQLLKSQTSLISDLLDKGRFYVDKLKEIHNL